MGMTITEKILAKKSGKVKASPGEVVKAKVDWVGMYELMNLLTYPKFYELSKRVWDPNKVVLVTYCTSWPPTSVDDAKTCILLKRFAEEQKIEHFYPGGHGCIHQMFVERYSRPGDLIVCTDSRLTNGAVGAFHTGVGSTEMAVILATGETWFRIPETLRYEIHGKLPKGVMAYDLFLSIAKGIGYDGVYRALEYAGPTIREMSMDSRICMCILSIEVGAKNAIMEPDSKTLEFVKNRIMKPYGSYLELKSDDDAKYFDVREIDASDLEPHIAEPPNIMNSKPLTKLEGRGIDQAVIGTCSGGRLEDLETAARILKGQKIDPKVELIITPASRQVLTQAINRGIFKILYDAGAHFSSISCGTCIYHEFCLGPKQVRISNQNRNYPGRSGDPSATVLLASAATVAASAVEGQVTDPRKYL